MIRYGACIKNRARSGAKLAINGRDVKDETLKLTFDPQGWYWHCEGNAYEIEMTENRKAIKAALEDLDRCQVKEIVEATGQKENHVRERLAAMASEGIVTRIQKKGLVYWELTKTSS